MEPGDVSVLKESRKLFTEEEAQTEKGQAFERQTRCRYSRHCETLWSAVKEKSGL